MDDSATIFTLVNISDQNVMTLTEVSNRTVDDVIILMQILAIQMTVSWY